MLRATDQSGCLIDKDKGYLRDTPFHINGKPIIKLVARQSFPECFKQMEFYISQKEIY